MGAQKTREYMLNGAQKTRDGCTEKLMRTSSDSGAMCAQKMVRDDGTSKTRDLMDDQKMKVQAAHRKLVMSTSTIVMITS